MQISLKIVNNYATLMFIYIYSTILKIAAETLSIVCKL